MPRALSAIALAAVLGGGEAALASDADLLFGLPQETAALEDPAPVDADPDQRPGGGLRWRAEANVTGYDRRLAYPTPPSAPADSTTRLRAVVEGDVALGDRASLRLNAALNFSADNTDDVSVDDNVSLDLREAYLLFGGDAFTLELGRINIRNGVALGFNPTDFFRAQDVDQRPNLDPTEARLNRLGVLAARVGYLWESGAVSLTYAPEVTGGDEWMQDKDVVGLNLAATNPEDRVLLSISQSFWEGFSPEAFVLCEDGDATVGLGASVTLGDNWIVYGEWSRGPGLTLLDGALADARAAGTLAPPLVAALGAGEGEQDLNRAAIGFSYTSPTNLIATLEYHYNGAGFDKGDWDDHFDLADAVAGNPAASGQLALVSLRGALMQEPMSMHSLFARVVQNDAFPDTTLTALGAMSLADYSYSLQFEAAYDITDSLVASARIGGNFGGQRTDFGSRSGRGFVSVGVEYHF